MAVEQRIVSSQKIGGGAAGNKIGGAPAPQAEEAAPKKSRKKLFLILGVVLVAIGAAAYVLLPGLLGGGEAAEPVEEPPLELGEVLPVDAISLNLSGGHYLRLGMGLQLTAEADEAPDPSRALDLAIALFSGRSVEEVSDPATREELKATLTEQLTEAYEGEVIDVLWTNYVTQ